MSESAAPLGIFGGTFDPLHVGHLRLAIEAREALGLGEVRFVPAGNPPLRAAPGTPAADRLAMVERALAGVAGFAVDSAEVRAAADGRPSYTVDSLERLRRALEPDRPLVLLLGADAFARLDAWHRWRDLFDLAHIAVATRAGLSSFLELPLSPIKIGDWGAGIGPVMGAGCACCGCSGCCGPWF